ncbi:hypothetical protein GOP47_0025034, partial [Adiantum capillus-veneris]
MQPKAATHQEHVPAVRDPPFQPEELSANLSPKRAGGRGAEAMAKSMGGDARASLQATRDSPRKGGLVTGWAQRFACWLCGSEVGCRTQQRSPQPYNQYILRKLNIQ